MKDFPHPSCTQMPSIRVYVYTHLSYRQYFLVGARTSILHENLGSAHSVVATWNPLSTSKLALVSVVLAVAHEAYNPCRSTRQDRLEIAFQAEFAHEVVASGEET